MTDTRVHLRAPLHAMLLRKALNEAQGHVRSLREVSPNRRRGACCWARPLSRRGKK